MLGKERSFQQDFAFGLRQLSDIALLGLSPGVRSNLRDAGDGPYRGHPDPPRHKAKRLPDRTNEYESGGGKVIIRVGRYGFDDVVGFGLDQIRRSAFTSGQVAVLDCFLEVVYFTMRANVAPDRRRSLWERALAVGRLAPREITDPRDAANLVLRAIEVGAPLLSTPLGEKVGEDLHELARFSGDLPGGERIQRGSRSRCGREASGDHTRLILKRTFVMSRPANTVW